MAEENTRRIDIAKLDKAGIDRISSDIARALTTIARDNADDPAARFHLKVGHINVAFRNSTHSDWIIGHPDGGGGGEEPGRG